jgi:hypothetical protein
MMTPKVVRADELGRDRIRAEGRSAEKPGGVPSRITPPGRPEGVRGFLPECSRMRLKMRLKWFSQDQKATGVVGTSVFVFGAEVLELYQLSLMPAGN